MNLAAQLQTLIANDPQRLRILQQVRELDLPDCWVAAGFVRSAVWDHLHQRTPSPLPEDIDVIWFDRSQTAPLATLNWRRSCATGTNRCSGR